MIIRKYGIELHRLTHKDIHLVREMRNREDIRSRMHEQDYITEEMQERWFHSIDNMYNYFFLIFDKGEKVGLVQAKDVDFDARSCEPGIYLWDAKAKAEGVSVKASLVISDVLCFILGMKSVFAKVRQDNQVAYRHNLSLGFLPAGSAEPETMRLDQERFLASAPRLRKICSAGKDLNPTTIEDVEIHNVESCLYLYEDLPDDVRTIFAEKIIALR